MNENEGKRKTAGLEIRNPLISLYTDCVSRGLPFVSQAVSDAIEEAIMRSMAIALR